MIEYLSGLELGKLINKKEMSPVEVITYFLDRIEAKNKSLNAFTYVRPEDALAEANALQKRLMKGEDCGLFAGVPVGLKDFLLSKQGWTNSHGGVKSLIAVDDGDSMFYDSARKLGAIAVGKTNAPPFGFKGTCDNAMYGPTRNPFNYLYNSGGSSGGTAAAVAAGLIPLGEGGDAGGSIRIPAAWCNCYGFKSSLGTVPSYCRPDAWAATHPYCFNGAITRTVEDSAAIMNVMARYNPKDPISLPINANKDFVELMKKPVKGLRVAVTYDFDLFPVDADIKDSVNRCASRLAECGCKIEQVKFNFKHSLDEFAKCWCWAISLDTSLDLKRWKEEGLDLVGDHRDELTEEFIYWNDVAANATIDYLVEFNSIRTDILDQFESVFEKYDIILSPISCCGPLTNESNGRAEVIGGVEMNPETNFISFAQTFLVNFVGYPAASVPAGLLPSGLPVGAHIIGKKFKDEDVFSISYALEQVQPWDKYYSAVL